jgi:hypothetical protein
MSIGMARSADKLLALLEERFGVRGELAGPLRGVLDQIGSESLAAGEWDALLRSVAEAYQAGHQAGVEARDEVHVLASELGTELRKIDESLKVLGVYLQRIRSRLRPPTPRLLQ